MDECDSALQLNGSEREKSHSGRSNRTVFQTQQKPGHMLNT